MKSKEVKSKETWQLKTDKLKKELEQKNRELEIEAALERLRARSSAMHKSNELKDVVRALYKEFKILVADIDSVNIQLNPDSSKDIHYWASVEKDIYPELYHVPYSDLPIFEKVYNAFHSPRDEFFDYSLNKEEKDAFFREIFKVQPIPPKRKKLIQDAEGMVMMGWFHKHSGIDILRYNLQRFSEEEKKIVKRFAATFEQTYTRFLDLQKAEAQAREAEIQLALERVRAQTMAMRSSNEMQQVANAIYEQMKVLGLEMDAVTLGGPIEIHNESAWVGGYDRKEPLTIPYDDSTQVQRDYNAAIVKRPELYVNSYSGKAKKEYMDFLLSENSFPRDREKLMRESKAYTTSVTFAKNSHVQIIRYTDEPYSDAENAILIRFGKVFEQAYIRFLDLQKAEAQAREAEIQLALERVRARTMAMHKSDELAETAAILFQQMTELGVTPERINICLIKEADNILEVWATDQQGIKISHHFKASLDEPTTGKPVYDAWKEKKKSITIDLSGKELKDWIRYVREVMGMTIKDELVKEHRIHSVSFFSQGLILTTTPEPLQKESIKLLERFADVFNLTYRRFLDLQKAEAQAREAEIQLALERVRAKTMAMQKSEDLSDAVKIVFDELEKLNLGMIRCGIGILNKEKRTADIYTTTISDEKNTMQVSGDESMDIHPLLQGAFNAWENNTDFLYVLEGDDLSNYYKSLLGVNFKLPESQSKTTGSKGLKQYYYATPFQAGGLFAFRESPFPDESKIVMKRFADVFNLTYTRFNDLLQAEAQAREAQIEAALERVRSLALSMRKSEEVGKVTDSFFAEFNKLTVRIIGCSIIVADEKNDSMEIWRARSGIAIRPFNKGSLSAALNVIKDNMPEWYLEYRKAMGSKKGYLQDVVTGEKRLRFLNTNVEQIGLTPGEREKYIKMIPAQIVTSFLFFKLGYLALISEKELPEENLTIARRFVDVFDFAYTRFLDLQRAEAQAREAVKQASLDRVRGEIASMRTSGDLNRITPVIWHELQALEVPFIRCGVFIVEEEKQKVQVYLTTPDGKALGALNLSFDANKLTSNSVENWRKKRVYKEHWNKEEFIAWIKSMMELGQVQNAETYQGTPDAPESLNLHFVPFKQGMLYVGDTAPLTDEKLELVKTLAEAFSIAYARYEDFKNLEEAKNKIESTLNELKAAQNQLVQAEKMASLGELTAGIAHEIQNPLNFVNNFSEVSTELLEEMKEEIENGNLEEVKAITKDVIQNLEKILHHGKRADGIVKGMLQHSRGSSGQKELTDINALADEYLRLSYHGLRAQDKSFNADFKLGADEKLPKINVVPQDIGRVLLNLINNAFYAVSEKAKQKPEGYKPEVIVSTSISPLQGGQRGVEISVKDNGNGIPESVKEKIFQPFFTTKPTGSGTGLGLSLSYDIVKAHGGQLKVETKEGIGTEVIVELQ